MNVLNEIVDIVKNGNDIDPACEVISKGNLKKNTYNLNAR